MLTELLASMVAISAAAHALDALYGQLVTPDIKVAGPRDDKGREAHIRECLKRRFDTGKRDQEWVSRFQRLFDLRDAAVHADVRPLPAVPHPSGVSNAGQVNADYREEGHDDLARTRACQVGERDLGRHFASAPMAHLGPGRTRTLAGFDAPIARQ